MVVSKARMVMLGNGGGYTSWYYWLRFDTSWCIVDTSGKYLLTVDDQPMMAVQLAFGNHGCNRWWFVSHDGGQLITVITKSIGIICQCMHLSFSLLTFRSPNLCNLKLQTFTFSTKLTPKSFEIQPLVRQVPTFYHRLCDNKQIAIAWLSSRPPSRHIRDKQPLTTHTMASWCTPSKFIGITCVS